MGDSGKGCIQNGGVERLHKKSHRCDPWQPGHTAAFLFGHSLPLRFVGMIGGTQQRLAGAKRSRAVAIQNGINDCLMQIQLHHFILRN